MTSPKVSRSAARAQEAALRAKFKADVEAHCMRMWVEGMITYGGDPTRAASATHPPDLAEAFGERMLGSADAMKKLEERRRKVMEGKKLEVDRAFQATLRCVLFDPASCWNDEERRAFATGHCDDLRSRLYPMTWLLAMGTPAVPSIADQTKCDLLNLIRKLNFEGDGTGRLQLGRALLAWAVPEWPSLAPDLILPTTKNAENEARGWLA